MASAPPLRPETAGSPAELEARTLRRVRLRLIPFLGLLYVVAYLDRVNVGFAALQMNADLGLSASGLRPGRGHLLRRLLPLRGAQQPDAARAWARACGSRAS